MASMQTSTDQKTCCCSCHYEHFVQFLARHPWVRRAFSRLGRSKIADWSTGLLARRFAAQDRDNQGLNADNDVRAMLEHYVGNGSPLDAATQDPDCEFFKVFTGHSENRDGLVKFLKSLDVLDPGVRRGLLKTWLHATIFTATIRKATLLHDGGTDKHMPRPMDAIVAHSGRCNLHCRGCYTSNELDGTFASTSQLDYVVRQLQDMNVFHVLLIGKGEPFHNESSTQALFEVVRRHPQMFFSIYSNGTCISAKDIRQLKSLPNLFPLLSIDGPEAINDGRRGAGVYHKVIETFQHMQQEGLLFGFISTVFQENRDLVLAHEFTGQMASLGCKLGIYSLFVSPDHAPCREMMLSDEQREQYFSDLRRLGMESPVPLIDIDALEIGFGCRAKRGATIYIDAITGQVSPCVRSPYSPDSCNIYRPAHRHRLAEIVDSEYFRIYRQQSPVLPCDAFHRAECGMVCR